MVSGVKHPAVVFQVAYFALYPLVPLPVMKIRKVCGWVEISPVVSLVVLPQAYLHAQVFAVLILVATSFEVSHLCLSQRYHVRGYRLPLGDLHQ